MHTSVSFEGELRKTGGIYKTRQYVNLRSTLPPKLFLASFCVNLILHGVFFFSCLVPLNQDVDNGNTAEDTQEEANILAIDSTNAHQENRTKNANTLPHTVAVTSLLILSSVLAGWSIVRKFHVDYARYAGISSGFLAIILFITWVELASVQNLRSLYRVVLLLYRWMQDSFAGILREEKSKTGAPALDTTAARIEGQEYEQYHKTEDEILLQNSAAYDWPQRIDSAKSSPARTTHLLVGYKMWMYLLVAGCNFWAGYAGTLVYRSHRNYVLQCFIQENSKFS
ncbi:unnamed protein product [Amoebophrya sp. A120]|nr:unnamed protein product [Amoebophrya sp. A120]|eukprot:GSA120T00006422001.1